MKKIASIIIIFSITIILVFFLYQRNDEKLSLTEEENNYISNNKDVTFQIGYYNSAYERLFVNKLCNKMSSDTGLKIVPYNDTWQNTMKLLKEGSLQMACNMNITNKRMNYLNFTNPFISLSSGVYSSYENPISNYRDLQNKTIGVIRNVSLLEDFAQVYPRINFKIEYYDNVDKVIDELDKGNIDGYISTKSYDEKIKGFYYFKVKSISKENNHIGVHKNDPFLYSIISKETDLLVNSGWDKTIKSVINFELERRLIEFSKQEKEYIKKGSVVTVGIPDGNMLYAYGEKYYPYGVIPAIFEKIDFLSDIDFIYRFDSYENLKIRDDVDIIVATNKNNLRRAIPIFSNNVAIASRSDMPSIKEIYDIAPYVVGVIKGNPDIDNMKDEMPNLTIKTYDSYQLLFENIKSNEIDYAIMPLIVYDSLNSNFRGIVKKGSLDKQFHYGIVKNEVDFPLVNIINKCIAIIDVDKTVNDEILRMVQKEKNYKVDFMYFIVILFGAFLVIRYIIIIRKKQINILYIDNKTGLNNVKWLKKKIRRKLDRYTYFMVEINELELLERYYGEKIYQKVLNRFIDIINQNISKEEYFVVTSKGQFIIAKTNMEHNKRINYLSKIKNLFGRSLLIYDMRYKYDISAASLKITEDILNFDMVKNYLLIALEVSKKRKNVVDFTYDIYSEYQEKINFDTELSKNILNENLQVNFRSVYDNDENHFAYTVQATCHLNQFGELSYTNFENSVKKLDLQEITDKIILKKIINKSEEYISSYETTKIFVNISEKTLMVESFFPWLEEQMKDLKNVQLKIMIDINTYEKLIEKEINIDLNRINFAIKDFAKDLVSDYIIKDIDIDIVILNKNVLIDIEENYDLIMFIIDFLKKSNKKIMVSGVDSQNQHRALRDMNIDYLVGQYMEVKNESTNS